MPRPNAREAKQDPRPKELERLIQKRANLAANDVQGNLEGRGARKVGPHMIGARAGCLGGRAWYVLCALLCAFSHSRTQLSLLCLQWKTQ